MDKIRSLFSVEAFAFFCLVVLSPIITIPNMAILWSMAVVVAVFVLLFLVWRMVRTVDVFLLLFLVWRYHSTGLIDRPTEENHNTAFKRIHNFLFRHFCVNPLRVTLVASALRVIVPATFRIAGYVLSDIFVVATTFSGLWDLLADASYLAMLSFALAWHVVTSVKAAISASDENSFFAFLSAYGFIFLPAYGSVRYKQGSFSIMMVYDSSVGQGQASSALKKAIACVLEGIDFHLVTGSIMPTIKEYQTLTKNMSEETKGMLDKHLYFGEKLFVALYRKAQALLDEEGAADEEAIYARIFSPYAVTPGFQSVSAEKAGIHYRHYLKDGTLYANSFEAKIERFICLVRLFMIINPRETLIDLCGFEKKDLFDGEQRAFLWFVFLHRITHLFLLAYKPISIARDVVIVPPGKAKETLARFMPWLMSVVVRGPEGTELSSEIPDMATKLRELGCDVTHLGYEGGPLVTPTDMGMDKRAIVCSFGTTWDSQTFKMLNAALFCPQSPNLPPCLKRRPWIFFVPKAPTDEVLRTDYDRCMKELHETVSGQSITIRPNGPDYKQTVADAYITLVIGGTGSVLPPLANAKQYGFPYTIVIPRLNDLEIREQCVRAVGLAQQKICGLILPQELLERLHSSAIALKTDGTKAQPYNLADLSSAINGFANTKVLYWPEEVAQAFSDAHDVLSDADQCTKWQKALRALNFDGAERFAKYVLRRYNSSWIGRQIERITMSIA